MKNAHLVLIASAILLTISLPFAAFGQTDTSVSAPETAPVVTPVAPVNNATMPKKEGMKKDNLGQEMKKINMEKRDAKKEIKKEVKKDAAIKKIEKKEVKNEIKKEIKKEAVMKKVEKKMTKKAVKKEVKKNVKKDKNIVSPRDVKPTAPVTTPATAPATTPATTPTPDATSSPVTTPATTPAQ